ncbi:MAG: DUF4491 family protein [Candidatus Howiella sp.]|jgi:hypothetical protein
MNFQGVLLGALSFVIIGAFHPIVIKAEYHFGRKSLPFFAAAGVIFVLLSLLVQNVYGSVMLGLIAFSSFWSIKEVIEQEERVKKGWFPKNPKKDKKS